MLTKIIRPALRFAPLLAAVLILSVVAQAALAATYTFYPSGKTGYDISYPQKNGPYPLGNANGGSYAFGIVGVNNGKPFTQNPYLSREYTYILTSTNTLSSTLPSFYMNTAYPVGSTASYGSSSPVFPSCLPSDKGCQSFNYGYNSAAYAYSYAVTTTRSVTVTATPPVTATVWWLDVETANSWSPNAVYNTQVISGAVNYLQTTGVQAVGIYSTQSMWNKLMGRYNFYLPIWVAGASSADQNACNSITTLKKTFNGGPLWLVQYWNSATSLDEDYACAVP